MQITERTEQKISKTAIWVAAARAVGAREPDPAVRNPDYLAERLLGDPAALPIRHPVVDALAQSYDDAIKNVEVVGNVRFMLDAVSQRCVLPY